MEWDVIGLKNIKWGVILYWDGKRWNGLEWWIEMEWNDMKVKNCDRTDVIKRYEMEYDGWR